MDFEDTPEEAAWRDECKKWITTTLAELGHDDDPIARARAWQTAKFDAGFARIQWEPDLGGRCGTAVQQIIFNQEAAAQRTPPDVFIVGLGIVAPTLRTHGTPEQNDRYLRPLLRGEAIWCQMFSEPGAGSDSAGLATSAVRDGNEWVINGQKVWTSHAHFADYGEILCRTNPELPKHRGITAFIVDLNTPGVTIRPLKQMNGEADFNEVFLDDVRVPHENVIGEVDNGWQVAVTTLNNERSSLGSGGRGLGRLAHRLRRLLREDEALDLAARQRIVNVYVQAEITRYLGLRAITAAMQGREPGPEASVSKLLRTRLEVEAAELGVDLLGAWGTLSEGPEDRWITRFLWSPAHRLGGGTDEVIRNVIAERALGLPVEPRTDDQLPWKDVPRTP